MDSEVHHSIKYTSSAFNSVQQSDIKTPEVLNAQNNWNVISGKPRSITTTPFLTPTKSVSNVRLIDTGSSKSVVPEDMITQDLINRKKKNSASTFSNDELTSNTRASFHIPTKKYSAPPPSSCRYQHKNDKVPRKKRHKVCSCSDCVENDETNNFLSSNNQHSRNGFLRLFAKRLSDKQLVFFLIPKDVRTIQLMSPWVLQHNMFPVFVFYCNKAIIGQRLSSANIGLASTERFVDGIFVENFCKKSETSTLAHLRQQIYRREKRDERKNANAQNLIEVFFATKSNSDPREGDYNNGADKNGEKLGDESIYINFNLANYCELVFEEYIFTKCYVSSVYACLGQEIFVPSSVLLEIMEYRCEHVRIDIGSINEILNDTCVHMKRRVGSHKISNKRKPQKLFSSSSSSSLLSTFSISSDESDTESDELNKLFLKKTLSLKHNDLKTTKRIGGVIFKENGECEWDSDSDSDISTKNSGEYNDICEDELTDFRQSFDELLKQHLFIKVPGLTNYLFYWPKSVNSLQMMSIDHIVEGIIFIFFQFLIFKKNKLILLILYY